ncbi:MAG: hypothetical protein ACK4G5_10320 [Devosia sp.]|jgi:hypothetical protein|uniref:hypothetical protein n=1 Tax=Devosia sp. XGJD_8 TaxID=3391187 RepID=UPI001E04AFD8|nr:hypothetical protein [Alphaproteobacteria bacterium]MBU1562884.1 hypothetical protein [Alphaproteobacteria bacterium]MBU2303136.1 hypothetical protein [Alphaproteobacteria bacterium]MBU2368461.1 hypothetical protein [Alphaproteobacteria bacterium]
MIFDSLRDRMGGNDKITPMAIAHNSLFTAREKLDLLHQLKSDVTGASQEGKDLGFDAEEIDLAIAEVRQGVQDGVGGDTVIKGDF